MKGFLLAAGLGTRLQPVTNKIAKPAVCLLNTPLFYWSYHFIRSLISDTILINTHHLPETIQPLSDGLKRINPHLEITLSHEKDRPLGSGGALNHAKKHLLSDENFLIANADEVILENTPGVIARLNDRHMKTGAICTLLVMRHPEAGRQFGGVFCNGKNILGFGKNPASFPDADSIFHYVGVAILNRRILQYLPETGESNLLYDGVSAAIKAGETATIQVEELFWHETGNEADFLTTTESLLQILAKSSADHTKQQVVEILTHYDSDTFSTLIQSHSGTKTLIPISASTMLPMIKKDSLAIHDFAHGSFLVIGKGACIQAPLSNSVVLPGTTIKAERSLNLDHKIFF